MNIPVYAQFFYGLTALVDLGLLSKVDRSHSDTPHSVGLVWTIDQPVPLFDNTQHSQETGIYIPGRVQTRNPSKRAAVDIHL
jgi:hypothetical protein